MLANRVYPCKAYDSYGLLSGDVTYQANFYALKKQRVAITVTLSPGKNDSHMWDTANDSHISATTTTEAPALAADNL